MSPFFRSGHLVRFEEPERTDPSPLQLEVFQCLWVATTLAVSGLALSFQLELVFAFVRSYEDETLHAAQLRFFVHFVVLGLILCELEMKSSQWRDF